MSPSNTGSSGQPQHTFVVRRMLEMGGQARSVGSLAAHVAAADVVDACVVEGALRRHDLVVSSDEDDLQAIATAVSRLLEVDRP